MKRKFKASETWDTLGITKHHGGEFATRKLIEMCKIRSGQHILEIGCGTGYSACLIAKEYDVDIVAVDLRPTVLEIAKKRIVQNNVGDRVKIIRADAHDLKLPSDAFDTVIIESVLVFCDKKRATSEIFRVLKPEGTFGDNEATYLRPPPESLTDFLSNNMASELLLKEEKEWRDIFRESGFVNLSSKVYKIDLLQELNARFKVEGVRKIISAWIKSIANPNLRDLVFDKKMRDALKEYMSYVGYGLYLGSKK